MEGKPKANNAGIEKEEEVMDMNVNKEGHEKHIIDCDADPFVPEGWTVEEHQKGGQFEWDPSQATLYSEDDSYTEGNRLQENLVGRPVLNANVLDFLLFPANQHLIPEEWIGKTIHFWGTIYRDSDGMRSVRCFSKVGGRWVEGFTRLNDYLHPHDFAALRKAA